MRCKTFDTFMTNGINQRYMEFNGKAERAYKEGKEKTDNSFLQQIDKLFTQCHKMQKEGRKNAVGYVMIYPLRMGFQSGSYEVMISLLDSTGWTTDPCRQRAGYR